MIKYTWNNDLVGTIGKKCGEADNEANEGQRVLNLVRRLSRRILIGQKL